MSHVELLAHFEKQFSDLKKEMKISSSLEELDEIFYLRDMILKEGFVSNKLSRMLCSRIVNTYMSWSNYLHGLVMPNPNYMVNMAESQMFTDDDRQEIINLMNQILALVSLNSVLTLENDTRAESKFIDESVKFWKKTFQPKVMVFMKKVNKEWMNKAKL